MIYKRDRMKKQITNVVILSRGFVTREAGFKMSTSFAIWPSEKYEVKFNHSQYQF